jgi:hypothetical protein
LYSEECKSILLRVFGSSPQLRLLDFFMDNPGHDFSRNEVMDAIGMAKRTLYDYLRARWVRILTPEYLLKFHN